MSDGYILAQFGSIGLRAAGAGGGNSDDVGTLVQSVDADDSLAGW